VSEYGGEPVAGSGVVAVAAPGAVSSPSPLPERCRRRSRSVAGIPSPSIGSAASIGGHRARRGRRSSC